MEKHFNAIATPALLVDRLLSNFKSCVPTYPPHPMTNVKIDPELLRTSLDVMESRSMYQKVRF
jgi:hypothetical protein